MPTGVDKSEQLNDFEWVCSSTCRHFILLSKVLSFYQQYEHLYTKDCEKTIAEFQATNPHPSEYEALVDHYERLETEIKDLPSTKHLNAAILLNMG